jgi:hypothetical protein
MEIYRTTRRAKLDYVAFDIDVRGAVFNIC